MLREGLYVIGAQAAQFTEDWQYALDLNESALNSMNARKASSYNVVNIQYNDYFPLIRLGRLSEAEQLLMTCQQVYEENNDLPSLGKVFTARASIEDERGNLADALAFQRAALRYSYQLDTPYNIAIGHANLADYLAKSHSDPLGHRAHRLAAALIHYLGNSHRHVSASCQALAHEISQGPNSHLPKSLEKVISVAEQTEGVRLGELLARLNPDVVGVTAVLYQILAIVSPPDSEEKAGHLMSAGNRFYQAGEFYGAFELFREAFDIYKKLPMSEQAVNSNIVITAYNASLCLIRLGEAADALGVQEMVVRFGRTAAESEAAGPLSFLALALSNQARILALLAQHDSAVTSSDEAIGIYQRLHGDYLESSDEDLAIELHEQAERLHGMMRDGDAFRYAQRAAAAFRDLAAQDPEKHGRMLSASLRMLASISANLENFEESIAAAEEVVSIYRALSSDRPQKIMTSLAIALSELGSHMVRANQTGQAFEVIQESVRVYRTLRQQSTDGQVEPELAWSLISSAVSLVELERYEDATAVSQLAVTEHRILARSEDADISRRRLVMALIGLADSQCKRGQNEDGLASVTEATTLARDLPHDDSDLSPSLLARALHGQAYMLILLGRQEEILAIAESLLSVADELSATSHSSAIRASIGDVLFRSAIQLGNSSLFEESLGFWARTAAIYRDLAELNPEGYLASLAASLSNQSYVLGYVNQGDLAISTMNKAIDIYLRLTESNPEVYQPIIESRLHWISIVAEKPEGNVVVAPADGAMITQRKASEETSLSGGDRQGHAVLGHRGDAALGGAADT